MAKRVWKFVKSKKIFIVLLILYTVVFILAVRFIFHILPILLGGLLGWITAPLCRLLEKRLDGSDNYELVSTDSLAMSAGTYSHPSRKTPFDERSGEFDSGRPKGEY